MTPLTLDWRTAAGIVLVVAATWFTIGLLVGLALG